MKREERSRRNMKRKERNMKLEAWRREAGKT
jgi:hypothetical protein